jgi:hypothetical protein
MTEADAGTDGATEADAPTDPDGTAADGTKDGDAEAGATDADGPAAPGEADGTPVDPGAMVGPAAPLHAATTRIASKHATRLTRSGRPTTARRR